MHTKKRKHKVKGENTTKELGYSALEAQGNREGSPAAWAQPPRRPEGLEGPPRTKAPPGPRIPLHPGARARLPVSGP